MNKKYLTIFAFQVNIFQQQYALEDRSPDLQFLKRNPFTPIKKATKIHLVTL